MKFDINDRNLPDVVLAIRLKELVCIAKENETIKALDRPGSFSAKVLDGILDIAEEYLSSLVVKEVE